MVYQASADSMRSLAVAQAGSGGTLTNDPYPIALANAHLIAAAPDMYEALEALAKFHLSGGHEGDADEAIGMATAALAKARGEAK